MWLVAEYEASSLFTLKPATATASGGKTLLVPTPFAVKMALLDAACRLEGQGWAEQAWDGWLASLVVALRPADTVVVNNTFIKVLRPRQKPAQSGSRHAGFFQQTIAYREYAYLEGPFALALELAGKADPDRLAYWLANINYLGKRGSFIQLQRVPELVEDLPGDFLIVDGQARAFDLGALPTQLDDVGELSFARANIYSSERIELGKHRVLRHVVLPYRLVASSRSYSHYQRSQESE